MLRLIFSENLVSSLSCESTLVEYVENYYANLLKFQAGENFF